MKKIEYQKIALEKFKKEYLETENSFELRAFISGWQSCAESYLKEDNKKFVIKDLNKKDQFINIDQSSGGYPYSTTIDRANFFISFEEAEKYKKVFHKENWEIKELYFKTFSI